MLSKKEISYEKQKKKIKATRIEGFLYKLLKTMLLIPIKCGVVF